MPNDQSDTLVVSIPPAGTAWSKLLATLSWSLRRWLRCGDGRRDGTHHWAGTSAALERGGQAEDRCREPRAWCSDPRCRGPARHMREPGVYLAETGARRCAGGAGDAGLHAGADAGGAEADCAHAVEPAAPSFAVGSPLIGFDRDRTGQRSPGARRSDVNLAALRRVLAALRE